MEDPGGREEAPTNIELEFRKFDEKDYTSHRNVYVGVHMPYGRKHHHRHHRHRHHKRKHCNSGNGLTLPSVDSVDHTPPSLGGVIDPTTPVNPCDRVKFILGEDETALGGAGNSSSSSNMPTCGSRQLFTEMDELCCYPDNRMEWKETARWIQFEEDLEEDADRWSKPHVATLSLRSLFELRSCVLRGSVQLDLDADNLCQIVDLVLDNLVSNNYLEVEYRALVREALLQRHCHHNNSQSSGIGLRRSSSQFHHGDDSSPVLSRQTSVTSDMRRNSSFSSLRPIKSLLSSLQLQQQESVTEEVEEGVANRHLKVDQHVMKKLPSNAEASNVLVGEVDSLPHTVIAFVRLATGVLLGDLTEVPVPTRFIFVLLGPLGNRARYHEVGRSIATLMSDPVFHDVAYKARCREDLLAGIDEFLDKVTVLPPGEWDPQIRIEPPDNPPSPTTRVAAVASVGGESPKNPRANTMAIKKQVEELVNFQCEKRPFSGLIHDGRRWRSRFLGDLRDALHWNSLAAILLLFFVTLTLATSLGEELSRRTEDQIGVPESLLASCIGNLLTPLFGGQPLIIMAASKSTLVFDELLYEYASSHNLPFLAFRFWIGFWAVLMLLLLVATNASGILLMLTRFTLELFSVSLSIVFIVFIVAKFWDIHHGYNRSDLFYPYQLVDYDCECYQRVVDTTDNSTRWKVTDRYNCTGDNSNEDLRLVDCIDYEKPEVFYLAIILLLGTFLIAWYIKKFYHTPFLTSLMRRIISKFAVPISMILWIVIDFIANEDTTVLPIDTDTEQRLSQDRNFIVNPRGSSDDRLPVWAVFAAIIPAAIVTLLVSVQHLVSIHFINKKLKKGRGYHLDLLVATAMVGASALLGFPWILAALVPSLAHVNILTILSPGKQLPSVREQRVTGFIVGLLLAVSFPLRYFFRWLPLPVLYGVLLLVGVASLSNIQFVQRVALLFITDKHKPDCCYVRNIPNRWIHLFTLIQLVLLVVLCTMVLSPAVLALPVMVAVIALIRWLLLGFLFSTKHLEILDDPLIKLRCLPCERHQLSSARTNQQLETSQTSHDSVDGVEESINISVEMEKCDLWRHVSYTERSPRPTIRVIQPTTKPHHQCTAV